MPTASCTLASIRERRRARACGPTPPSLRTKTAWGAAVPTSGLVSGQWGANANDVWVVLPGSSINGNQFAAVPEPGTVALLLAGCFALVPIIRRRMKKS